MGGQLMVSFMTGERKYDEKKANAFGSFSARLYFSGRGLR